MAVIKILMIMVERLATWKVIARESLQNPMAPNNKTKRIVQMSLEYIIPQSSSSPNTGASSHSLPGMGFQTFFYRKSCGHLQTLLFFITKFMFVSISHLMELVVPDHREKLYLHFNINIYLVHTMCRCFSIYQAAIQCPNIGTSSSHFCFTSS